VSALEYSVLAVQLTALTCFLLPSLRNFDILAAVFTDVLKFMHEDLKSE
jgi:hypothetical protein